MKNPEERLDCVVIGYNEMPFTQYESFLRQYGRDSEAYRDLQFSFVDLDSEKLDYIGLLNRVFAEARSGAPCEQFKSGAIPNLAAVYLTNFLRRHGHTARYINLYQHEQQRLLEYLALDPVCVALTTTFYVVNLPINEMVKFIREHNPSVKIVVGGALIANHCRNYTGEALSAALEDMGADIYVVEGQGEHTLAQIVGTLKDGGSLANIPNLIMRAEDGALHRTRTVPENNSLDENFIDWREFADEDLGHTIQTRTARSCAFKCSFCNYPARAGALSLASIDVIEKELDSMLEVGGVKNVVFIDDTFNVPFPRFKDICRMMIRKQYPFNWFSYFRCSNSDEEAIDLMAESGCKGVFLGIESGSPRVLTSMNKAATVEKYATGIEMLRRRGILTFASFIVGFPSETEETVDETIGFLQATRPDYYRAQLWYCEAGTPIERQREQYRIEGEGFVWSHATMDSLEAMDHIDRIFLSVKDSTWLPQWSFDFWIIPYLVGLGISFEQFKQLMTSAQQLLSLEIATVPAHQKSALQREHLQAMVKAACNGSRAAASRNR
jgi:radical SAM PhpK family P-methyltransferase